MPGPQRTKTANPSFDNNLHSPNCASMPRASRIRPDRTNDDERPHLSRAVEPKSAATKVSLFRLITRLFLPNVKGFVGEKIVSLGAMLALPRSTYVPFHNVTLPTPDGTTQIDHVFVSRYGVFVVETKNMSGWIFGSEKDKRWTQVFPNGQKSRFQNPLRQNYKHVKAVEEALSPLGLPKECVRSAVVFVGEADLKTPVPRNVTVGVGLARYIKSFTDPVLSERQVQAVCEEISSEPLTPSWSTHREHVRTLKSRKNPAAARKCPRCGKDMLLRTARRGDSAGRQFWGCSGYPSCRTVQDVGGP